MYIHRYTVTDTHTHIYTKYIHKQDKNIHTFNASVLLLNEFKKFVKFSSLKSLIRATKLISANCYGNNKKIQSRLDIILLHLYTPDTC